MAMGGPVCPRCLVMDGHDPRCSDPMWERAAESTWVMPPPRPAKPLNIAFVCGSRATPVHPHKALLSTMLFHWLANAPNAPHVVVHGDCRQGPDSWAHLWAKANGVQPSAMEALWDVHRRGAGPKRNAVMRDVLMTLRAGGALVTCFAMPYGEARGTRGMMKLLEGADFAVEVLDG